MKKLLLIFALILCFAFPSISSQVVTPARSVYAFITGGTITAFIEDVVTGVHLKIAQWGGIYTNHFLLEVARGNIAGYSIITKFGENTDIDEITVPETVWDGGGRYAFYPTVAQPLEVASTDVDDTGDVLSSGIATGGSLVTLIDTGADFVTDLVAVGDLVINDKTNEYGVITSVVDLNTLFHAPMVNGSQVFFLSTANAAGDAYRVVNANDTGLAVGAAFGLDQNWEFLNEIFVLDGTTAVDLTQTFIRIHRMAGIIGGTEDGAEGDVILRIDGAGTIAGQMVARNNKTLMATFTIPANKIGYFLKGYVATSKSGNPAAVTTAAFKWNVKPFGSVWSVNGLIELISTGGSSWQYKYEAIPGIPPQTDIDIRCTDVSDDNTGVVAGFDLLLVDFGA
jgi:hypothetical protein